jgi:hypothetical protein
MANLVIIIPFTADPDCDLDNEANNLLNFFQNLRGNAASVPLGANVGVNISNINIVYPETNHAVAEGDYVILFAHGGQDDSALTNNMGQSITVDAAAALLAAKMAQNAAKLLCMCCYSALQTHIAQVWRAEHPQQQTYGSDSAISNLYSSTRQSIRAVCAALSAMP